MRQALEERAKTFGSEYLFKELVRIDPESAKKIYPQDSRRIIRAIEVYHTSGKPISNMHKERQGLYEKLPIKIFGLRLIKARLYERINERTDKMFNSGVQEEVKELLKLNLSLTAKKIIGIKEIEEFLEGKLTEKEAQELMKKNTRNFAKRQITWFKKDERVEWIDVDSKRPEEIKNEILTKLQIDRER